MKTLTWALFLGMVLLAGVAQATPDPTSEHGYACFKVSDPFAFNISTSMIAENSMTIGGIGSCSIYKSGIKKHCVPVNVDIAPFDVIKPSGSGTTECPSGTSCPLSPLADVGPFAKDLVCYRLKCIDGAVAFPTQTITDAIGTRTLTKHKRMEVCLPADNSAVTTTTTTTLP